MTCIKPKTLTEGMQSSVTKASWLAGAAGTWPAAGGAHCPPRARAAPWAQCLLGCSVLPEAVLEQSTASLRLAWDCGGRGAVLCLHFCWGERVLHAESSPAASEGSEGRLRVRLYRAALPALSSCESNAVLIL